jgi:hypothetical protein
MQTRYTVFSSFRKTLQEKYLPNTLFSVEISNSQLQYRRKRYPQHIRNLHVCDPVRSRPNHNHRPYQCAKNQEHINTCQEITFHFELQWCVGKIKNQIQNKGKHHKSGNAATHRHQEYDAKRNQNENIEERPDWAEEPGWWRP